MVKFHKEAHFISTTFNGLRFFQIEFINSANFSNVNFNHEIYFAGIRFKKKFLLVKQNLMVEPLLTI